MNRVGKFHRKEPTSWAMQGSQVKVKMLDEVIIEEKYSQMLQVCSLSDVCWSIFMVIITSPNVIMFTWHYIWFLLRGTRPNNRQKIPNGRATQFVLVSSGGVNLAFNTSGITENWTKFVRLIKFCFCRLRDLIVLAMRAFQEKVCLE
jgi:hypothetical protein